MIKTGTRYSNRYMELEKKSQSGRTKQTKHDQWYTIDNEQNKILQFGNTEQASDIQFGKTEQTSDIQFGKTEQTSDIQFNVKRATIAITKGSSWS